MTPDAKMPTRSIGKQSILKEIKSAKRTIISHSGCVSYGMCISAMEHVAALAILVADGKWNSPKGRTAVYEMRRRIVTLRRNM
jgi:hypothetical protein